MLWQSWKEYKTWNWELQAYADRKAAREVMCLQKQQEKLIGRTEKTNWQGVDKTEKGR